VDADETRARVAAARVARLATVRADGTPHVVPVCFAVVDDEIVTAVDDAKPKSTTALRRLDNVRGHPAVAVLVDHYDDDWSALWWVRADGTARVDSTPAVHHVAALAAKYAQYRAAPPPGPAIVVTGISWSGWSAR
jgi:PPOX class probable F420-dependent enzyme